MVCAQCGAVSDEGQRFCYNCGSRLDLQQPASAPASVAVAAPQQQTLPPPPAQLQPPSYQQPMVADTYPQAVPNSNLAVISLVSGILAWVLLPLLAAIVAVISGHMARSEIRRSGGSLAGQGLALIGMILGYVQLALIALGTCAALLFFVIAVAA